MVSSGPIFYRFFVRIGAQIELWTSLAVQLWNLIFGIFRVTAGSSSILITSSFTSAPIKRFVLFPGRAAIRKNSILKTISKYPAQISGNIIEGDNFLNHNETKKIVYINIFNNEISFSTEKLAKTFNVRKLQFRNVLSIF